MASISFEHWANIDKTAAQLSMQYDEYQSYRSVNRSIWEEVEAYVYATDCTTLPGLSDYDHTTMIPVTSAIKEEAEAIMYNAIFPHSDYMGWEPLDFDADSAETRRKVLAYLRNRHMLNGFERVLRQLIQDLVMYGNCFAQARYVDERKNGIGYVGPKVFRISPYDIVFDPTRSSFEKTPKFIRDVMTIAELEQWAKVTEGVNMDVLEDIKKRRLGLHTITKTELNKNKQYCPDGFTDMQAYYDSNMVELLWFYGDVYDEDTQEVYTNQLVVVVDRVNVLLNVEEDNPNIFKGSWSQKPDNLWSQGPLEKIIGINFQINHRENSKSDALDRAIYPDRVEFGEMERIYDIENGTTRYIGDQGGQVQDITPDMTVLTFDGHIDRLMMFAREAAGLPPQMQGFRTPGEKTLGEVQSLYDAAMRKFLHRAAQLEMDLIEPLNSAEIAIGRKNFQSVVQAASVDQEGLPEMLEVTQDDLKANGRLVPKGARRFAQQTAQLNMLERLSSGGLMQFLQPHIDTYKLALAVEQLGEFDDMELVDKWASIREQSEAQLEQTVQQQELQATLGNPGATEMMMDEE